jgi:phosphatidylserine/phosphatidylglycerophosphate/cardiolipin synthase-like enzyme
MHHKFAVACKCHFDDRSMSHCFEPYSVWTGSFNPTSNGTRSRENAVIIESESTANFYLKEWAKMFAMSEPLDWYHEWCAPQYRIGT